MDILIERDLDPNAAVARRVSFALATAEARLGIAGRGIPLRSRLEQIIQEAMARPAVLSPGLFEVAFRLHSATVDPAPTTETAQ